MGAPPPPPATPHYHPAPYLSTGSGSFLSATQLAYFFQDFHTSLEHVQSAPQLVFERLVANLGVPVLESIKHARCEVDLIKSEKQMLQSSNDKLVAKVSELESKIAAMELDCSRHPTALEKCVDEKTLQSLNDRLMAELVELKSAAWAISRPAVGAFHTSEEGAEKKERKHSKVITFTRPILAPPVLALGLTSFHLSKNSSMYGTVFANADDVQSGGFDISITAEVKLTSYTLVGELYSAGCSWLELNPDDPDFQCGQFNINEHHQWYQPQGKTDSLIAFPRAYSKPPIVVVWLNGFVLERTRLWQLHTYADNVTTTDFLLHVDTQDNKQVYMANVSWVACSVDKPNVWSGSFGTPAVDPGDGSTINSGYVEFRGEVFTTPPRVVMGINRFQQGEGKDLELAVKASNITASGMTWGFDSFSDTKIHSAGASYIALG